MVWINWMKELMRDSATPIPNAMSIIQRSVFGHYSLVVPQIANPKLILSSESAADLVSGHLLPDGQFVITPENDAWAWNYGGHQFGIWAGQLGDGRAISIGQLVDSQGSPWEIQFKGAGLTPFSRAGDGFAVLRSSIREFIASEAMFNLAVPTTRALSLLKTDTKVVRESIESGAVVIRLAPTWIRFGNFELLFSRGDIDGLRSLADFSLRHFFPENKNGYLGFIECIVEKTALMIAKWQAIGFCHGVMNTDNFSILGLTLDYGPYQFLDDYDPNYICNKSDDTGRYTFGKQPEIAFWNISRLALALRPLIEEDLGDSSQIEQRLLEVLKKYPILYDTYYKQEMVSKLGLYKDCDSDMMDLVYPLLDILKDSNVDYTLFFRSLSDGELNVSSKIDTKHLSDWMERLGKRLEIEEISRDERNRRMLHKNPIIIPRNHHLQSVINQANSENYNLLLDYWNAIKDPYSSKWNKSIWAQPPTEENRGMRCSCSS